LLTGLFDQAALRPVTPDHFGNLQNSLEFERFFLLDVLRGTCPYEGANDAASRLRGQDG